MPTTAIRSIVFLCALCSWAQAQSNLTLPGCEARPALSAELSQKLDDQAGGYRSNRNFATIIYLIAGKLELSCQPS